ncbi:hypothetical protein [Terriglobus sp. RCC_193]|uniref:hypothetical protein n=1 Tax=Terriglobus sp. RCC_193 TaxID=3239218 RepID=UPI0035246794
MMKIVDPRFYETERGYQGALVAQLTAHLDWAQFSGTPIVEQEYQKTLPKHGITIRPDVIIHVPVVPGHPEHRTQGNFVAFELKRRASTADAVADYESLRLLARKLAYPLTIFINLDSEVDHREQCPPDIQDQTVSIAVRLVNGAPIMISRDFV